MVTTGKLSTIVESLASWKAAWRAVVSNSGGSAQLSHDCAVQGHGRGSCSPAAVCS